MSRRAGVAATNASTISAGVLVNFGIGRGMSSYSFSVPRAARSIFPERRNVAPARELPAESEHRRVRRDDDELVALRRGTDGSVDGRTPLVHDLELVARHARVFQAIGEIARPNARRDDMR